MKNNLYYKEEKNPDGEVRVYLIQLPQEEGPVARLFFQTFAAAPASWPLGPVQRFKAVHNSKETPFPISGWVFLRSTDLEGHKVSLDVFRAGNLRQFILQVLAL